MLDTTPPLLGRAAEQALLDELLDEVAERVQALVLRGEPGIGKSRLLAGAARAAREGGMTVLTTTAVQSETHLPFAGLHQLLRPVRARAAALPPIQRAALDAAFGLTHEPAPEHFRIAMAVLDLISDIAHDAPLVLVVEDCALARPADRGGARVRGSADRVRPGAAAGRRARWLPLGARRRGAAGARARGARRRDGGGPS